jgi:hypothetical protein
MRIMVCFALIAYRAVAQSPPSCENFQQPKPDSKFAFTQASLIGLTYALAAVLEADAFQAEQNHETNTLTLLTAMMRHTKVASNAYACAEKALEPYRKSRDQKMIGFTSNFEVQVYKQHRALNDAFLDMLRKLPDLSNQPTNVADVISEIEVERGKLWDDLTQGATLTLLGLVDQNKPDGNGKLNTLVITRAERRELIDGILRSFPRVNAKTNAPDAPKPEQIASLYYLFLTKPYECSDE